MSSGKVIDADGHIIERSDELRHYLKAPFNKRGGPLTASEPWDRDLRETLPHNQSLYTRAPRAEDWLRVMDQHDIELAFLYPIAVTLRDDGVLGLVVLLVFVFTVVEALTYIWKKGALEWRR